MKLFIKTLITLLILVSIAFAGYYFYLFKKLAHKQNTILGDCVPSSQWSDCNLPTTPTYTKKCSEDTPAWIDIINPNENATYKANELIEIRWITCNVKNLQVGIGEQGKDFSVYVNNKIYSRMGQYEGKLGWNPKPGNEYFISIKDISSGLLQRSGVFTVKP